MDFQYKKKAGPGFNKTNSRQPYTQSGTKPVPTYHQNAKPEYKKQNNQNAHVDIPFDDRWTFEDCKKWDTDEKKLYGTQIVIKSITKHPENISVFKYIVENDLLPKHIKNSFGKQFTFFHVANWVQAPNHIIGELCNSSDWV